MEQKILDEIKNQDYSVILKRIQDSIKHEISTNNTNGVIFGLSGGIDSAVMAYLCADVIKDKTINDFNELI